MIQKLVEKLQKEAASVAAKLSSLNRAEKLNEELQDNISSLAGLEKYYSEYRAELLASKAQLERELVEILEITASEKLNSLGRRVGKNSVNLWGSQTERKFDFQVLEVTGKIGGVYTKPKWYQMDMLLMARRYAMSLEQANVWVAEACVEGRTLYTGKRKRVNLNHPDAMFPRS